MINPVFLPHPPSFFNRIGDKITCVIFGDVVVYYLQIWTGTPS